MSNLLGPIEELVRFRRGLEEVAKIPCGIPGHAVAVGCGASGVAQSVLDGETNPCGRCSNQRTVMTWELVPNQSGANTAVPRQAPCPECSAKATGKENA